MVWGELGGGLTGVVCDIARFVMKNLPDRINARRRGEVWPEILSDVLYGIDAYAIDAVIPNKCLDPVIVSLDDLIVLRIHVDQRDVVIPKPALFYIGLIVVVRDPALRMEI